MSELRKVHVLWVNRPEEIIVVTETGDREHRFGINAWELRGWYRDADGFADWRFEVS